MSIETTIIPTMRQVIYGTYASFATSGLSIGDLAWATDRQCLYRWSGSAWENVGISSRHGLYANRGTASDYPESSLYQADDTGALYMVVTGAWVFIATSSILFGSQYLVTGSRAFTTVYQNTQGKPMLVEISVNDGGMVDTLTAYCDSAASPTTIVGMSGAAASNYAHISFIVPNNYYYKLTHSGSGTLSYWVEYY